MNGDAPPPVIFDSLPYSGSSWDANGAGRDGPEPRTLIQIADAPRRRLLTRAGLPWVGGATGLLLAALLVHSQTGKRQSDTHSRARVQRARITERHDAKFQRIAHERRGCVECVTRRHYRLEPPVPAAPAVETRMVNATPAVPVTTAPADPGSTPPVRGAHPGTPAEFTYLGR